MNISITTLMIISCFNGGLTTYETNYPSCTSASNYLMGLQEIEREITGGIHELNASTGVKGCSIICAPLRSDKKK